MMKLSDRPFKNKPTTNSCLHAGILSIMIGIWIILITLYADLTVLLTSFGIMWLFVVWWGLVRGVYKEIKKEWS